MPDEVVHTPFGKFLIDPADIVGSTVKAGTVWDGPGFLQVIAREHGRLGEVGTTILDVGAHLGDWAVWLCREGAWRVVAVEPSPHVLTYLKANLDLNKDVCADRVIVLPVAAYDRETTLQWTAPYATETASGNALGPATAEAEAVIPAVPLDRYQALYGQRVSLIKIDAQGCDFAALRGLEQTIRRDQPVIVFEWEAELAQRYHEHTLGQVFEWLATYEYHVLEWPSQPNNYLAVPRRRS